MHSKRRLRISSNSARLTLLDYILILLKLKATEKQLLSCGFCDSLLMVIKMDLPKRKPTRLKDFDYSTHGAYFVTICTKDRRQILSRISVGQGLAPAEVKLMPFGKIAEKELNELEKRFPCVTIDKYVIMPNHIHIIVFIKNDTAGASPCPTLSDVMCAYKSLTTRKCKAVYSCDTVFQSSFYDHIIRDYKAYAVRWNYIENNPARWCEDKYYIE